LRKRLTIALVAAAACLPVAYALGAGRGSLDRSFGHKGSVATTMPALTPAGSVPGDATAAALLAQPDGRQILLGSSETGDSSDFALARYFGDGTLDRSFGVGGKVITPFGADPGASDAHATAAAITADQRVIVAGLIGEPTTGQLALARYTPDGALDPSFGKGGEVVLPSLPAGTAVTVQPDGKILVAGNSPGPTHKAAIARLNADGSLDSGFGSGGVVDLSNGGVVPRTVFVEPGGGIVVAGGNGLLGLQANGAVDGAFGHNGTVHSPIRRKGAVKGAIEDDLGRLLVFGYAPFRKDGRVRFGTAVVRYHPDGKVDRSFGRRGRVIRNKEDFARGPVAATIQHGEPALVGTFHGRLAILRLKPDGAIDPHFGHNGRVVSKIKAEAAGVTPGAQETILVGGSGRKFRLARFNG
jgi:uncharacterized delta-60 repeat protein